MSVNRGVIRAEIDYDNGDQDYVEGQCTIHYTATNEAGDEKVAITQRYLTIIVPLPVPVPVD